jgi:hypothetical protein
MKLTLIYHEIGEVTKVGKEMACTGNKINYHILITTTEKTGDREMEPITLCGLVIVMFGLWVEFEPTAMAIVRAIGNSRKYKELFSHPTVQRPVYKGRMPLCFAKTNS